MSGGKTFLSDSINVFDVDDMARKENCVASLVFINDNDNDTLRKVPTSVE